MNLLFASRVFGQSGSFVNRFWPTIATIVGGTFPLAKTMLGYFATRPAVAQFAAVLVEQGTVLSTRPGFGPVIAGMGRSMQNLMKYSADSVASLKLSGGNVEVMTKFQTLSREFVTASGPDRAKILGSMLTRLGDSPTNLATIFGEKKAWGMLSSIAELTMYSSFGMYLLDEPDDMPLTDNTAKRIWERTFESLSAEVSEVMSQLRKDNPDLDDAIALEFERELVAGLSAALHSLDQPVIPAEGLGTVLLDASSAMHEADKVRTYFSSYTGSEAEASLFLANMRSAFKLMDDGVIV